MHYKRIFAGIKFSRFDEYREIRENYTPAKICCVTVPTVTTHNYTVVEYLVLYIIVYSVTIVPKTEFGVGINLTKYKDQVR